MKHNSLKEINLIVFDEPNNFHSEPTQDRIGGKLIFKEVFQVQSREDFDNVFERFKPDEKFVFVCHVFHAHDKEKGQLRGYFKMANTGIEEEYNIKALLVSSGDSGDVMNILFKVAHVRDQVYQFSDIRSEIKEGRAKIYTKESLQSIKQESVSQTRPVPFTISYGIITALYGDEFQEIEKLFNWEKDSEYVTDTKVYRIGSLKTRPDKKVVAAVPSATGMIDAAIIATQMMELFKPNYLIMSGVCGGRPEYNFGSIIIASKIYQFQKGKLSETFADGKVELFDESKNPVQHNKLYDKSGNQVKVYVQKFEIEHDTIIEIDPLLKDRLQPHLERIESEINKPYKEHDKIKIEFGTIACSTMVINKEDFYQDIIKPIDRKTVAVEMESYGVARACRFANNGKTKFLIFKSIMDHMANKGDSAKRFAAYTSAQFLSRLLADDLI